MFSRLSLAKETPSRKAIKLSPSPKSSPEYFSIEATEVPHSAGPTYSLNRLRMFAGGEDGESERQAGRALMPLPWPMQAKLKIGAVDDPLEREADRVAEQVLDAPNSPVTTPAATPAISRLQRKCSCGGSGSECEACKEERQKEEKPPQRKATRTPATGGAPAIVHEVLNSPGQPLDKATRAFFEPRFGYDFSQVRIHADSRAAESARSVNALAYTVGRNIVFDSSHYAPHTHEGRQLLGHEMAHVIQQGGSESPSDELRVDEKAYVAEREAIAETALSVMRLGSRSRSSTVLQRQQKAAPKASQTWGPDEIEAGVWNKSALCGVSSNTLGETLWGPAGSGPVPGSYKGHCADLCAHSPVPLRLDFLVDGWNRPRTGVKPGDKLSRVVANVKFVPAGGGQDIMLVQGSGDGTYDQLARSLKVNFRTDLSNFSPPGPGSLQVSLINDDIGGGGVAAYSDEIPVVDCPGVRGPGPTVPRSPVQTGRWLSCPDPEQPQRCYPADWNSPPPLYEVEKDDKGTFYRYRGRRMNLEEKTTQPQTMQPPSTRQE
jgi:Domain of unknown function (DUF4157)